MNNLQDLCVQEPGPGPGCRVFFNYTTGGNKTLKCWEHRTPHKTQTSAFYPHQLKTFEAVVRHMWDESVDVGAAGSLMEHWCRNDTLPSAPPLRRAPGAGQLRGARVRPPRLEQDKAQLIYRSKYFNNDPRARKHEPVFMRGKLVAACWPPAC